MPLISCNQVSARRQQRNATQQHRYRRNQLQSKGQIRIDPWLSPSVPLNHPRCAALTFSSHEQRRGLILVFAFLVSQKWDTYFVQLLLHNWTIFETASPPLQIMLRVKEMTTLVIGYQQKEGAGRLTKQAIKMNAIKQTMQNKSINVVFNVVASLEWFRCTKLKKQNPAQHL